MSEDNVAKGVIATEDKSARRLPTERVHNRAQSGKAAVK